MGQNIIAVVDCDSFFVSCEQNECPELWGQAVCVLGNNDGCVVARSKEAKKIGVRMGMPYFMAKKEFPDVIYLSGNMDLYIRKSNEIMAALRTMFAEVEQYSIDEAFVNMNGLQKFYNMDCPQIAAFVRAKIKEDIGIPVSIGVSTSKTLAKLASIRAKKSREGVYVISRMCQKELKMTQIDDVWGLGRKLVPKLNKYDVKTAFDYVSLSDEFIIQLLGKKGYELKQELLGNSMYPVNMKVALPKSIQKTSSFPKCTSDKAYIKNALHYHIHTACKKLRKTEIENISLKCFGIGLYLKTKNFQIIYDKIELKTPTNWELDIISEIDKLFEKNYNSDIIYRSSGVILFNLVSDYQSQCSLFDDTERIVKSQKLGACIDNNEAKFGRNIIKTGFFKNIKDI